MKHWSAVSCWSEVWSFRTAINLRAAVCPPLPRCEVQHYNPSVTPAACQLPFNKERSSVIYRGKGGEAACVWCKASNTKCCAAKPHKHLAKDTQGSREPLRERSVQTLHRGAKKRSRAAAFAKNPAKPLSYPYKSHKNKPFV